jgi:hypothetical protein
MYNRLATITGTFAILAAALLAPGRADAGGATSAPSKYAHASQLATAHQVSTTRQTRRTDFAITEYSSSSAKSSVPHR